MKPSLVDLMHHYDLLDEGNRDRLFEYTQQVIEMCAQAAENTRFTQEGPSHAVAYQRFLAADTIREKMGIKSKGPVSAL